MLKELLMSVASGVIVAMVLQMFRLSGGSSRAPRQTMYAAAPPRRRGGGFFRFLLAVAGGLVLAVATAPFVLQFLHGGRSGRRFFDGDGPRRFFDSGYYDRGYDGIFGLPPLLVLTIIGTVFVWMLLSAMSRR